MTNPGYSPEHLVPVTEVERPTLLVLPTWQTFAPARKHRMAVNVPGIPHALKLWHATPRPAEYIVADAGKTEGAPAPLFVSADYGIVTYQIVDKIKNRLLLDKKFSVTGGSAIHEKILQSSFRYPPINTSSIALNSNANPAPRHQNIRSPSMKNLFNAYLNRRLGKLLTATTIVFVSGEAAALRVVPITNGYDSCSWTDNGDGTSTIGVKVFFKAASDYLVGGYLQTRGIQVYRYNDSGHPVMDDKFVVTSRTTLNGVTASSAVHFLAEGWSMVMNTNSSNYGDWRISEPFTAFVNVVVNNSLVSKVWPALSLLGGSQAANIGGDKVYGDTRAAYVSRDGANGGCQIIIDPTNPPPPVLAINVTAPDWNLGELPRGDGRKTFEKTADQLCFTYSGTGVRGKNFVINASNANGIVNNRYQLKNVADTSQIVPYNVTLDSGASTVSLPNRNSTAVPLSDTGKTCFVPTFNTTLNLGTALGNYSDVLTFNVVIRS
ncbi:hypothetical protein [Burkholderia catarinensis]|uniref:hypothetical protein n=1 Tax=Burkholderia catarinensis TaxID=1108140 RepID=UPI001008507C|nr:hypothetical protein [Burkholderia catarinensis]